MSDGFETVMGPLGAVRDRAREVLAGHGLDLKVFAVLPGAGIEGPHEVQMVVTLADDGAPATEDFERVVAEAHEAEVRARADRARDDLRQRLKGTGGFLD